ncbi:thiamine pyrophosphate-binding protein [Photobacterium damselae]|uniref:thiamine pyrophosphate-binding protein n=1 Tax=Photobacterium damselae TaxID=38293 RepID=UPI003B66B25D
MKNLITKEINAQIVISLLKSHGITKVVASPGTTNVAFIASIQNDPYFSVYSSVDERSAAYIACGLAEESGEPVVISCTGATASRNYAPGLTEAYYRKLPVLAITSMQDNSKVGHLVAQVIDRSSLQNDIVKLSVQLPIVKDRDDIWSCEIKVNQAILELKRNGGGPVHINLPTTYTLPFENKPLPTYKAIDRIGLNDVLPDLKGKVAILVGSHSKWTDKETRAIDRFCASRDAVVFCDHSSSYKGKYRVQFSLVAAQELMDHSPYIPDVLIHIGEVTGDYASLKLAGKQVWRVNCDGEIRDTFRKLRYVFEMEEEEFFDAYTIDVKGKNMYFDECNSILERVRNKIPELPFSNLWVASQLASKIPNKSMLHLGILNSLRSWNYFDVDKSIDTVSNVGGFGIDGALSSLIGASLFNSDRIYFAVLGDLAFFYDMNSLGNRHVGNNIRILLINNGKGTEFRQYNHHAAYFLEQADDFIAAAEHYGNKSPTLVKNYVQSLGFEYFSAKNKKEFGELSERFLNTEEKGRSMVFEIFTNSDEESEALRKINTIEKGNKESFMKNARGIRNSGIKIFNKLLGK